MTTDNKALVPVWTLATEAVSVPSLFSGEGITPERLGELRTVLAALADSPIATLAAHPTPAGRNRTGGVVLNATSPLAQHLSQLVTQTVKSAPAKLNVASSGEMLYRMVVPAKAAYRVRAFGDGLSVGDHPADIAIEIERSGDGSLVVFPGIAA
jgi:hypothetical protein